MSFYDDISKYYNYIFPLENNKVAFVLNGVNNALRILDIGCSTGELAKSLSEQGNFVIGIDLDEAMIKIAKGYENDNLKFHCLNMLRICDFFDACYFDQIICFGNTLVHLNNDDEILVLFKAVRSLLKKDGSFKFQIINYDKVLDSKLQGLPTIENDKIKFVRRYRLDNNKIIFDNELFVKDEDKVFKNQVALLPVRKDRVVELLKKAGFDNIKYYSSFNKEMYNADKLPLVFEVR